MESTETITEIAKVLVKHFDDNELRTLCVSVDVNFDSLPGEGLDGKARELVGYMDRRNRLQDLIEAIRRVRPRVSVKNFYAGLTDEDWSNGGSKYRQANAQATQFLSGVVATIADNVYAMMAEMAALRIDMAQAQRDAQDFERAITGLYNRQDAQRSAITAIAIVVVIISVVMAYLLIRG